MPDREKVIKGLETCSDVYYGAVGACSSCPYSQTNGDKCLAELVHDAIDLLKEQEAVEPTVSGIEEYDGHSGWWYQCGKCKMPIDYRDRFCRHCGQAVQWAE